VVRPREFDTEVALERALQVFWSRGYEATSLDALQRAMGLSRSSIYSAFGEKHEVFLACLQRYTQEVGSALGACAAQPLPAPLLLERLFDAAVQLTQSGGKNRGCFLGNTSLEMAGRDPAARRHVRAGLRVIESIFAQVVKSGVDRGELEAADPEEVARFLTSSLQGMLVMAKAGADRATLTALRKTTLSTVNRRSS
jgi:TetR/AcrR family transcriptional repressor of nem operon